MCSGGPIEKRAEAERECSAAELPRPETRLFVFVDAVQNAAMSTFATSLKKEIARVARKELRNEILSLRKSSSIYRTEIAELKRKIKSLESVVKSSGRPSPSPPVEPKAMPQSTRGKPGRKVAFGAAEFAALRKKLGFTQAQMAQLVGASSLSIHKWESGQVTPRAAQLEKLFSVRKIGKREAHARIQA